MAPPVGAPVSALTRTMAVLADLERRGCRIVAATVLPVAAVRVDRHPEGIDTWGYRQPMPGAPRYHTEHVAILRGVRIVWEGYP
jgi:hypothetical protein